MHNDELDSWEPGKHGNGIVFIDGTVATWSLDPSTGLPGHEHGLRASGRDWEDVNACLVISPDGEVQLGSPMSEVATVDFWRIISIHDHRMHVDDSRGWTDMFA